MHRATEHRGSLAWDDKGISGYQGGGWAHSRRDTRKAESRATASIAVKICQVAPEMVATRLNDGTGRIRRTRRAQRGLTLCALSQPLRMSFIPINRIYLVLDVLVQGATKLLGGDDDNAMARTAAGLREILHVGPVLDAAGWRE